MPETVRPSKSTMASNVRLPMELQTLLQSSSLRSWVRREVGELSRSKGFGEIQQTRLKDAIRQKFLARPVTSAAADAVICILTAIVLNEYIQNSVGDDAQLANVDLQNALQKQQQVLQMISTISKLLYDTAMSVIRKIGG